MNHALRPTSNADADFVRALAEKSSLKYFETVLHNPPGSNVEAWAREQRYIFLRDVLAESSFDALLTAHTASDVVETYLIRLLSNKDLRGISQYDPERKIIRPLLKYFRKDIDAYAQHHSLEYCRDESNNDQRFLRNRIRHHLLPELQQNYPGDIEEILFQRFDVQSELLSFVDGSIKEALASLDNEEFESMSWLKGFREIANEFPESIRWRLVEEAYLPVLHFRLGKDACERILDVFLNASTATHLPGGVELRRRKKQGIERIRRS